MPTWAICMIAVPLVLLSPAIAFFLALAAEIVIVELVDAGAPWLVLLGAGVGGLVLYRRLRRARGRPALETYSVP